MVLDAGHRHALRRLRGLLESSGIRELLARYGAEEDRADARSLDAGALPEPLQTLARLSSVFCWNMNRPAVGTPARPVTIRTKPATEACGRVISLFTKNHVVITRNTSDVTG